MYFVRKEPQDIFLFFFVWNLVLSYVPLIFWHLKNSENPKIPYFTTYLWHFLKFWHIRTLIFWHLRTPNSDTSRTLTPLLCTGLIVHQGSHTWIIILYWTLYFKDFRNFRILELCIFGLLKSPSFFQNSFSLKNFSWNIKSYQNIQTLHS